jgi:hypothetical protein
VSQKIIRSQGRRISSLEAADRHLELDIELIAVPMYSSLTKREVDLQITITKPTVGNIVVRKLIDYR